MIITSLKLFSGADGEKHLFTDRPVLGGDWRKVVGSIEEHPAKRLKLTRMCIIDFTCSLHSTQAMPASVSLNIVALSFRHEGWSLNIVMVCVEMWIV